MKSKLLLLAFFPLAVLVRGQSLVDDLKVGQTVTLRGSLTPTQISADQNDYSPTSLSSSFALRLSSDATRNITGLLAGVEGRTLFVHNVGSFSIVLKNESSSSAAANRFAIGSDITMTAGTSVILRYDATSSRWRAVSGVVSSGGGSGDVAGPASSHDNAIVRFDGTGGKTIQDSGAYLTDDGDVISSNNAVYVNWVGDSTRKGRGFYTQREGTALTGSPNFSALRAGDISRAPAFDAWFAGGNLGALSATPSGATGVYRLNTYDGTNWIIPSAQLVFSTTEQHSGSAQGTRVDVQTTLTGTTTPITGWSIDGSGNNIFNQNTGNSLVGTTSSSGLSGSGGLKVAGNFYVVGHSILEGKTTSGAIGAGTRLVFDQPFTALGSTSGSVTLAWNERRTVTLSGNLTITGFTGTESTSATSTLVVVCNGSQSITFPASYRNGSTNATSTTFTPAAGRYALRFESLDGAGTYLLSDTVSSALDLTSQVTGALAIGNGGTGATTSYGAYDAISGAETAVASATTTDLGAVTSNKVSITGTTTITGFGTVAAGVQKWGRFTGALTLTHNATSLILPGAANITTAAGDSFHAVSLGSGNWAVYHYQRANGGPIAPNYQSLELKSVGGFTFAQNTSVYLGWHATAAGNNQRYYRYLPVSGTITQYSFQMYGSGGSAVNLTVQLLLNGSTVIGSTTIAANTFPGRVTVTGLSQAVTRWNGSSGDYIECRIDAPVTMTSITSFVAECDVTIKTN